LLCSITSRLLPSSGAGLSWDSGNEGTAAFGIQVTQGCGKVGKQEICTSFSDSGDALWRESGLSLLGPRLLFGVKMVKNFQQPCKIKPHLCQHTHVHTHKETWAHSHLLAQCGSMNPFPSVCPRPPLLGVLLQVAFLSSCLRVAQ
jgi:hypothetical protein